MLGGCVPAGGVAETTGTLGGGFGVSWKSSSISASREAWIGWVSPKNGGGLEAGFGDGDSNGAEGVVSGGLALTECVEPNAGAGLTGEACR